MRYLRSAPHACARLTALLAAGLAAFPGEARGSAPPAPAPMVEVLFRREGVVWGFDFLPDGRIVFTERGGFLGVWDPRGGEVAAIQGAPEVWAHGQGGLLDAKVHPDFARNRLLYLTWSHPVDGGAATALGRGKLEGSRLVGWERLLLTNAGGRKGEHFGSRLVFHGEHLFMTVGERGERKFAQDPRRHNGKLLRLTHDGLPAGAGLAEALPEIWTLGHRNPQGVAIQPGTGRVWVAEFGPRGGDELNLIKAGANYGWPAVTYGREYWGPRIGPTHKAGMEQPIVQWTPVISPSGLAFYDGDAFPAWKGSVFLACLSGNHLRRVTLDGEKAGAQEKLLGDRGWRFRQVRQGPDGFLYFSTDEGLLARLIPGK